MLMPGIIASSILKGAAAALWTPAELSLAQWIDVGDPATIILAGGNITQLNDKSGNNRFTTQTTPANMPTLQAAVQNGLSAARHDGSSSFMTMSVPQASTMRIMAVLRTPSLGSGYRLFLQRSVGGMPYPPALYLNNGAGTDNCLVFWGLSEVVVAPAIATTAFIVEYELRAGVEAAIRIDGDVRTVGATTEAAQSSWTGINVAGAQNSAMDLCEYFIINAELTTDERQKAEGYFAHRWGLTGQLPVSHPYKTDPPTL